MAEKKTKETAENTEVVKDDAYWEEKVPVRLPLNPGNPEDQTQFVSVNDYTAQILRGVEVMVPRKVAVVLRQSEDAEMEAFINRAGLQKQYEEKKAAMGL